jgi:hypothetical protein
MGLRLPIPASAAAPFLVASGARHVAPAVGASASGLVVAWPRGGSTGAAARALKRRPGAHGTCQAVRLTFLVRARLFRMAGRRARRRVGAALRRSRRCSRCGSPCTAVRSPPHACSSPPRAPTPAREPRGRCPARPSPWLRRRSGSQGSPHFLVPAAAIAGRAVLAMHNKAVRRGPGMPGGRPLTLQAGNARCRFQCGDASGSSLSPERSSLARTRPGALRRCMASTLSATHNGAALVVLTAVPRCANPVVLRSLQCCLVLPWCWCAVARGLTAPLRDGLAPNRHPARSPGSWRALGRGMPAAGPRERRRRSAEP